MSKENSTCKKYNFCEMYAMGIFDSECNPKCFEVEEETAKTEPEIAKQASSKSDK